MARVAYVNGRYVPLGDAAVHVEDRGFQFADAVYEVCEVRDARLVDEALHLARLARSLREMRIAPPMSPAALGVVFREIIRRNRIRHGLVYLQVSRGAAPRAHQFPAADVAPTVVVTARRLDTAAVGKRGRDGIAVVTVPETRWARVDIKTVSLLPNVLAKQQAREAGAFEAWFVTAEGMVTEGTSSNAWIVNERAIVTAPADQGVLRGVTRTVVRQVADELGLTVEERRFSRDEALAAREAFITSATAAVTPVVRIDERPIGNGSAGPVAEALRRRFAEVATLSEAYSRPRDLLR